MVIVDIVSVVLISLTFFSFSVLFESTIDQRYEVIQGKITDEDALRTVISVLRTEYERQALSDYVLEFCAVNDDLAKAKEVLKETASFVHLEVECPKNNRAATVGAKKCTPTERTSLIGKEPANTIAIRYC